MQQSSCSHASKACCSIPSIPARLWQASSTWSQKVGSRARKTSCSFTPEGPLAYSPTLTSCRRFERTCERQIPRGRHAAGTESCRSPRSEEHTSELQSRENLVCRLLLEKKNS